MWRRMQAGASAVQVGNFQLDEAGADAWLRDRPPGSDTELVLRAHRAGLRVVEIPVEVHELRQPGYVSVFGRTPEAVWNLLRLVWEFWR